MAAPFDSGVFDPGAFDTEPGGVSVHLTSPTGVATAGSTASGTVSTDVGNGTLYWLASANASESIATVKAGSSQAVAATGVQNVLVTGLTPDTQYYLHFTQTTTVPEDAAVVSSAAFTTAGTQLLLSPEAFDNAAWATFSAPTVTANVENDPNGNATVDNVNLGQDARQHLTGLAAGTYTLSALVKSGPATAATALRMTTNNTLAWNTGVSFKQTLTGTLTLMQVSFTLASTQDLAVIIGAVDATGAADAGITGNFRIAWAMLNKGSARGDFVPQSLPTVNASISAAETANDVASLSVTATAVGALSAAESGADTAAVSASLRAQASASTQESGTDVAAIQAGAVASASIAGTEAGQDVASLGASATAVASVAALESGQDTAAFGASTQSQSIASLAAIELGADTASILSASIAQLATAATEAGVDAVAISALALASASLAVTESANDAVAITGAAIAAATLGATESVVDTVSVTGAALSSASLATTEASIDTAFISVAAVGGIIGVLIAATEPASDTTAFAASARGSVSIDALESASDTAGILASAIAAGSFIVAEAGFDSAEVRAYAEAQGFIAALESGSDSAELFLIDPATINMIVKTVYKDALYTRSAQFGAGFQVAKSASPEYAVQSEKDAGFQRAKNVSSDYAGISTKDVGF